MSTMASDTVLRDCGIELRLRVSDVIYGSSMALDAENW